MFCAVVAELAMSMQLPQDLQHVVGVANVQHQPLPQVAARCLGDFEEKMSPPCGRCTKLYCRPLIDGHHRPVIVRYRSCQPPLLMAGGKAGVRKLTLFEDEDETTQAGLGPRSRFG